jgi:CubicO group peptidase (beta-lactamase class C family)
MKSKSIFTISLTLLLVSTGYAQTIDKAKLDSFFDRLLEKNKAMGSVTIARNGQPLYTRTIGYSQINGSEKKPLTTASRFRIGSITKMFTAVMILQLVEEGKLKLTDKLDQFFPQIPNAQKITIEQILWHRSGIHDALLDKKLYPFPSTNAITKTDMLATIARGTPDFEPDTKHVYSNAGYHVLGFILEKVTGAPYDQALKERITSRLGLKDTYMTTANIDVNKNESLTYFYQGNEWKQGPETHPSLLFSAGSIMSTPNDMIQFIQALFDLKLISKENLQLMKTIREGDGFGMEPFTFAGKTFYGHTGGVDNYGAWLAYQPEENLAIAYTTNAKRWPVLNILNGLTDIYYNKPFQIPAFATIEVSGEILDKYVGVYSNPEAPVKFTITREATTLYVQAGKESATALEALATDKFQIEGAVVIEFDAAKKQMTIKRRGGERVFTKDN